MHVLVTYDVSTIDPAGRRRLRRIAKACLDYGQRVQNSVFECKVDPGQFVQLKTRLCDLMNADQDSLTILQPRPKLAGSRRTLRTERCPTTPTVP